MDNSDLNLGRSLTESIVRDNVVSVASDFAELAMDASIDDGLIKDIPVFGWFVKAHDAVITVRERIFMKKIAEFLQGVRGITSNADVQSFRLKIQNDQKFSRDVGDKLILLLDRHEEYKKATMLGRVFGRYIMGELSQDEFNRIARAIDLCAAHELENIREHYVRIEKYERNLQTADQETGHFDGYLPQAVTHQLFSAGLIDQDGWVETTYKRNEVGRKLIKCMS